MEYFLALLVGLSLGLLGGGGSILTVPILIYVAKLPTKEAIALSLAIVGITGVIGVINHLKNKNIDFKISLYFLPTAAAATFLGAKLSVYMNDKIQLLIFALLMIVASFFMIKDKKEIETENQEIKIEVPKLIIVSFAVGILTGIVGVGGGFMIVPALVILTGMKMKRAVGTSLFIITINSMLGFLGYLNMMAINWNLLFKFSGSAIVGVLIGGKLISYIPQKTLKKSFGFFLIAMGIFVLFNR